MLAIDAPQLPPPIHVSCAIKMSSLGSSLG